MHQWEDHFFIILLRAQRDRWSGKFNLKFAKNDSIVMEISPLQFTALVILGKIDPEDYYKSLEYCFAGITIVILIILLISIIVSYFLYCAHENILESETIHCQASLKQVFCQQNINTILI